MVMMMAFIQEGTHCFQTILHKDLYNNNNNTSLAYTTVHIKLCQYLYLCKNRLSLKCHVKCLFDYKLSNQSTLDAGTGERGGRGFR